MSEDFDASGWDPVSPESEPVSIETLLDTLDSLSGQLQRSEVRLDKVEAGLGETITALQELLENEGKAQRRPRRYRFEAHDAAGQRQLWEELADFVDYLNSIFGSTKYTSTATWRIPDWWWELPIVVYELLALKASHDEAFTSTKPNQPTTEMIAWLDRWFWPCMNRIFNDRWGLRLPHPPSHTSSKVSIEQRVNGREAFNAHLDTIAPAVEPG